MAEIDIENPGASEAALRAAIQALVPISTTTISSPVQYVDFTLPSGYSSYQFIISHTVSPLAAIFSQNGGSTWLEDYDTDWLAYIVTDLSSAGGVPTSVAEELAGLSFERINGTSILNLSLNVYPGSAIRKATITGTYGGETTFLNSTKVVIVNGICRLNTARVNAIRFCYGVDGIPGDAGDIDKGTFTLYGVI